jgi:hypothetical protein
LVGLSTNLAGLSAKSAGWGFHCSNFESNEFRPVFTKFGRFFRKPAGSEGADFLVSAGFLNTAPRLDRRRSAPSRLSKRYVVGHLALRFGWTTVHRFLLCCCLQYCNVIFQSMESFCLPTSQVNCVLQTGVLCHFVFFEPFICIHVIILLFRWNELDNILVHLGF